mgnify:CR=1 FL=1
MPLLIRLKKRLEYETGYCRRYHSIGFCGKRFKLGMDQKVMVLTDSTFFYREKSSKYLKASCCFRQQNV